MFNLLLIDVAACVALIMVAAFVMVMRWHRRGRPVPKLIRKVRRSAAGDTEWRAPRRAAVVPGFSRERGQPGAQQDMRAEGASPGRPSAQAGQPQPAARSGDPARAGQPAQAVQPAQAGQLAYAMQHAHARNVTYAAQPAQAGQPAPAGHPAHAGRDGRAEQAARRAEGSEMAEPEPSRNGPGAAPDQQPDPAARSQRIGSYYDEADRAMSDYLSAMGWTGEAATDDAP